MNQLLENMIKAFHYPPPVSGVFSCTNTPDLLFESVTSSGIKAIYKVYRDILLERPNIDENNLWTALDAMKDFYENYLKWHTDIFLNKGTDYITKNTVYLTIASEFAERKNEIERAFKSHDEKQMLVALDNAVGQWHNDYPVIYHLWLEYSKTLDDPDTTEAQGIEDLIFEVKEILDVLNKLRYPDRPTDILKTTGTKKKVGIRNESIDDYSYKVISYDSTGYLTIKSSSGGEYAFDDVPNFLAKRLETWANKKAYGRGWQVMKNLTRQGHQVVKQPTALEAIIATPSVDNTADEKYEWFVQRTNKHINLVQQAAEKIVKAYPEFQELLSNVQVHDASKFEDPEKTPYISLTWRHKLENEQNNYDPINGKGYQTPGLLAKEDENQATLHHVTGNSHHPEYWLDDKSKANISAKDRNKSDICIDASAMPDIAIAEMIADWQAMSEELKKNSAREWFDKQKDVRWHFSDHQVKLIDKLLKVFEVVNEDSDLDSLFKPASTDEVVQRRLEGCTKNSDGTYSCSGDVDLSNLGLTKLPVKFKEVGGSFYCYDNKLTTLEGCPQKVGGWFDCGKNKLTTLKGCPQKVGGGFDCRNNQLTTLEGCPQEVGGGFICRKNKLTTLKGCPQKVGGGFDCRNNPVSVAKLKKTVDRDYL